jgi:hypothetical protein
MITRSCGPCGQPAQSVHKARRISSGCASIGGGINPKRAYEIHNFRRNFPSISIPKNSGVAKTSVKRKFPDSNLVKKNMMIWKIFAQTLDMVETMIQSEDERDEGNFLFPP